MVYNLPYPSCTRMYMHVDRTHACTFTCTCMCSINKQNHTQAQVHHCRVLAHFDVVKPMCSFQVREPSLVVHIGVTDVLKFTKTRTTTTKNAMKQSKQIQHQQKQYLYSDSFISLQFFKVRISGPLAKKKKF